MIKEFWRDMNIIELINSYRDFIDRRSFLALLFYIFGTGITVVVGTATLIMSLIVGPQFLVLFPLVMLIGLVPFIMSWGIYFLSSNFQDYLRDYHGNSTNGL